MVQELVDRVLEAEELVQQTEPVSVLEEAYLLIECGNRIVGY